MPNLSNKITFLFASDGSLASQGLSLLLQTRSDFLMVSDCSSGAAAVAGILAQSPEIAVIDAQLPDMTAAQVIEAVRTRNQDTGIVILGASTDRNIADQLLAAGADAYVVRSGPSRFLNDAIRYVRDGGKYLTPQLTRDLPVAAGCHRATDHSDAVSSLRSAVEAQGRTVERLEEIMERAQCAIELLQQKVEQLSGVPVEVAPSQQPLQPGEAGRSSRMLSVARAGVGSAAAAVVAILGLLLSGTLRPVPASPFAEFSHAGAAGLHLASVLPAAGTDRNLSVAI
jgi:DNA-binding NarL/FixJ family response regulator